ncbi:MAG: hypothetical protein FWF00_00140 [Endomicrobia bacterium]|nr:hypothetical protein [Endomicrobiia bacterium]MCL2506087.1 hypothetical protein [Endomicrobiia bacterium]
MPLYKTPITVDNNIYIDNQKKIQAVNNLKYRSSNNNDRKIYKWFKKLEWTIKDFFRNFHKVIKVILSKKDNNIVYIACIFGGGLGDMLISKVVFDELLKMAPNAVVDIYNKKSVFVLNGIKNIRFFFNIDVINITKKHYDIVYHFGRSIEKFDIQSNKDFIKRIKNNLEQYRKQYLYTGRIKDSTLSPLSVAKIMAGVDNIDDDKLSLNYKEQPLEKFGITKITKYITFNCGAGGNGNLSNVKCWSADNWEKLLSILKSKLNKEIKIVNVGVSSHHFKGADIHIAGKTSLDELCSVLKGSLLHIDIDGACVHVANALGKKSVVLFSSSEYHVLGYKENINISSSLCGGCWEQGTKCPIGYEKPLCMDSISPEFVAEKVIEYLEKPE